MASESPLSGNLFLAGRILRAVIRDVKRKAGCGFEVGPLCAWN
jgi:hypothetical protein